MRREEKRRKWEELGVRRVGRAGRERGGELKRRRERGGRGGPRRKNVQMCGKGGKSGFGAPSHRGGRR